MAEDDANTIGSKFLSLFISHVCSLLCIYHSHCELQHIYQWPVCANVFCVYFICRKIPMIIYAILRRKVPDKQNLQSNLKFSRFVEYFPVTISVQISHIAPKYVCVCVCAYIHEYIIVIEIAFYCKKHSKPSAKQER